MDYYVWVGPRESDCFFDDLFEEHICYFSENNHNAVRKANIYGNEFNKFVEHNMNYILSKHPNAKFILYNQKIAYNLSHKLLKHIECVNDNNILKILNDKIYMRYWMGSYVPVVPSVLTNSKQLSFSDLENKLCPAEEYVAQKNGTSGGFGTYCLSRNNHMLEYLQSDSVDLLIVSPYLKNSYSMNVNAVIFPDEIKTFAPSIQIIMKEKNRLVYHGADFIAAQSIEKKVIEEINKICTVVLTQIQKTGYRGIIGIDLIYDGHTIYFQEVNARYQSSGFLISKALQDNNLPSLSALNLASFYHNDKIDRNVIDELEIHYSFYKYIYTKNAKHFYHVLNQAKFSSDVSCLFTDGWRNDMISEEDAYCYSIVFSRNICSLNFDHKINLYSNIHGEEEYLNRNLNSRIGLKTALLNQGCFLTDKAKSYCEQYGKIKEAVFSSVDFKLANGIYINAPVNLNFNSFSPFIIDADKEKLSLYYYDRFLSEIELEFKPRWDNLYTDQGIPYNKIAYLSTDRLRLKHEPVCIYKKQGKGCHFCNIPISNTVWQQKDIDEVIECLFRMPGFRHVLIGGGTGNEAEEERHILHIAGEIRKKNKNMPIYVMSIPPKDISVLRKYYAAGITEVAFNIEIWNRSLAERLMPGKGQIPLDRYMTMLKESTKLWGKNGNVRTALIVGLNGTDDLMNGIETLCECGIQPMLSVFRPICGTTLEKMVPPSDDTLLNIYYSAQDICRQYGLKLGPTCDACKNNMLAI